MEKKKSLALTGSVCLVLVLAALPFVGASATEVAPLKPIELKFCTWMPPTHVSSVYADTPFCREIEQRSGGRLKVTIYYAEALGTARDQFAMIRDGVADVGKFVAIYTPGRFPLSDVGCLPLAAKNGYNLIDALNALTDKGYFDKEWSEVEFFGFQTLAGYDMLFRKHKPLRIEDLAGLKVRSTGGHGSLFLEGLKMIPLAITGPEIFSAYEKGIVDAVVWSPVVFVTRKLHEVPSRSMLDGDFIFQGNTATIFNKAKFMSLPSDIQKIIREAARKYAREDLRGQSEQDKPSLEVLAKAGVEIYSWPESEVERLRKVAAPIWERYVAELEAKGLPGKKLVGDFASILRKMGENPPYSPK